MQMSTEETAIRLLVLIVTIIDDTGFLEGLIINQPGLQILSQTDVTSLAGFRAGPIRIYSVLYKREFLNRIECVFFILIFSAKCRVCDVLPRMPWARNPDKDRPQSSGRFRHLTPGLDP